MAVPDLEHFPDEPSPPWTQAEALAPLLRRFVVLAREEHLTQAAAVLRTPPSSLSRSMARLQEALGFRLFVQAGRNIALTEPGRELAAHAERALSVIEDGFERVRQLLDPDGGHVRFSFLRTFGTNSVPALLAGFLRDHPRVQFTLTQDSTARIVGLLAGGQTDIAVVSPPPVDPAIVSRPVRREPMVVVTRSSHPLARQRQADLASFAGDPFILLKTGFSTRVAAEELFRQARISPRVAAETDDTRLALELVRAGLGVALLPVTEARKSDVKAIELTDTGAERTLAVCWSRDRPLTPSAKDFRDYLIDQALAAQPIEPSGMAATGTADAPRR